MSTEVETENLETEIVDSPVDQGEMSLEDGDESSELADFADENFVEHDQVISVIESLLFSTDKPQTVATLKSAFRGTQIRSKDIRKALDELAAEYASPRRGISLEQVNGGYQLRTKVDNLNFLKGMVKGRSFRLSGPALEVLSIMAYKQPCVKSQVDEIRGVESGHLVRSLMERGLVKFGGKSELPGKPMLYETTKKFLEIFGLRNIHELPSLSEIDELIPEGIGEIEEEKETLDTITDAMSNEAGETYSEGEAELGKITNQLGDITTSTDFFEQEKQRMKDKKEADKAQNIREAIMVGEEVSTRDKNWLTRYEEKLKEAEEVAEVVEAASDEVTEIVEVAEVEEMVELATEMTNELDEVLEATATEVAEPMAEPESVDTPAVDEEAVIGQVNFEKFEEDLKIFDEDEES